MLGPTAAAAVPARRTGTRRRLNSRITKRGMRAFVTQIHERDVYRALFSSGGSLPSLSAVNVPNLDGAIENGRSFAAEVVAMLREVAAAPAAQVVRFAPSSEGASSLIASQPHISTRARNIPSLACVGCTLGGIRYALNYRLVDTSRRLEILVFWQASRDSQRPI